MTVALLCLSLLSFLLAGTHISADDASPNQLWTPKKKKKPSQGVTTWYPQSDGMSEGSTDGGRCSC